MLRRFGVRVSALPVLVATALVLAAMEALDDVPLGGHVDDLVADIVLARLNLSRRLGLANVDGLNDGSVGALEVDGAAATAAAPETRVLGRELGGTLSIGACSLAVVVAAAKLDHKGLFEVELDAGRVLEGADGHAAVDVVGVGGRADNYGACLVGLLNVEIGCDATLSTQVRGGHTRMPNVLWNLPSRPVGKALVGKYSVGFVHDAVGVSGSHVGDRDGAFLARGVLAELKGFARDRLGHHSSGEDSCGNHSGRKMNCPKS